MEFFSDLSGLSGPGCPEWLTCRLCTIQATLAHLNLWLKTRCGSILALLGYKNDENFQAIFGQNFHFIFLQKLTWFPKNSGLPGGLLYVCYGILVKILNFTTAKPGRIPHFQIWSKTAKFAQKPQKWQFLAVLSTLSQFFFKKLFFEWFWAHFEQNKSLFSTFQNYRDFTIE